MASATVYKTVIGFIGNFISLFLFLSPSPTFVQIWRKQSVQQFSPVPYLATLANCMVWTFYGLPMVSKQTLVVTINGAGVSIEVFYILVFLLFSDKRKRLKVLATLLVELIFISTFVFLVLTFLHGDKRKEAVGIIAISFNVIMYASPLSVMRMVIATKSVEYMPFFLSLASFCNSVCWASYAFITPKDINIMVPNGLGTLFSLAQLILYAVYYKSTKRQLAARQANVGDLGLTDEAVDGDSKRWDTTTTATRNGHHSPAQMNMA